MNVRNPKNSGRKKGSIQKISQKDIELANHIRWFIKENDINLNVLRSQLGIKNSCIYYFMKEKTNLINWLPKLKEVFNL
jgi:hypothetical protein